MIGNYVGSGKARREVRSAVLNALATTEVSRWVNRSKEDPPFRSATRDLETAALIARIPRPAVQQYVLFADATCRYSFEDYDLKGGDEDSAAGAVDSDLDNIVQESAEIITQLAWRPWWSRITYRARLRRLRGKAAGIDDKRARRQLANAQWALRRFPGALGELYDEFFPDKK